GEDTAFFGPDQQDALAAHEAQPVAHRGNVITCIKLEIFRLAHPLVCDPAIKLRAASSAAGSLDTSLPPACAMFGRPPPPPPMTGAICLIRFPACSPFLVRSSVTATNNCGRSSLTLPSTITPLLTALRNQSDISRRVSGDTPSNCAINACVP